MIDFYHTILNLLYCLLNKKVIIDSIDKLFKSMKDLNSEILDYLNNYNDKSISDYIKTYTLYIDTFKTLETMTTIVQNNNIDSLPTISIDNNIKENYCKMISSEQFNYNILDETHRFYSHHISALNPKTMLRIVSEISSLKRNLPNCWDSSIVIRIPKKTVNILSFIIIGPKDTPYHNGIFEFHVYFPDKYPMVPPNILINTTDGGRVRFNPNLYACGKVCLSLLGTWRGEQGESWNPEMSTLLQLIISIQSLILVEQPYFNEPGYESTMHSQDGIKKSTIYSENIRLETIKVAMIKVLKNKIPSYEKVIEQHFLFKKDEILATVNKWYDEAITSKKDEMKLAIDELEQLLA